MSAHRYEKSHGIDSGKPYRAWSPRPDETEAWWTVLDCQGKNVLQRPDRPGCTFTTKADAEAVARQWTAL